MSTAICPGSFDPITLGHVNIVRRAASIFDNVVLCIMHNSEKKSPMFTVDEKVYMAQTALKQFPNVTVDYYSGFLAEYIKRYEKPVVVKGLRSARDFDYEYEMNLINKHLNPDVETMFIPSSEEYGFVSSTIVRDLAKLDSSIEGLVPSDLIAFIENKAEQWRLSSCGK